jgi:hypothetical protein
VEELERIGAGDVRVKGLEEDVWLWRGLYLKTNYCVRKIWFAGVCIECRKCSISS